MLQLRVGIPSPGVYPTLQTSCSFSGDAASRLPHAHFPVFCSLGSFLVRAPFHIVSWEGALCDISISKVSCAAPTLFQWPYCHPQQPTASQYYHLILQGYFISSCLSLFSQPQSCLLPCNVTSYTFPFTSFFTVCCRFFLSIWAKQSSHFSFHSTSLT